MRKNLGWIITAVLIFLACSSSAPAQERGYGKAVLGNGMTVLTREDGGDLVAACLFIKVGAVDENKDSSGITNLLNNAILSCHPSGNPNPPALKLEQLGGRVKVESRSDFTCFAFVAPTKNFGAALKVLGDAVSRYSCTDAALGVEKQALLAEEDMLSDRLEDKAYRLFLERTYSGLPYGLDPEGDPATAMKLEQAEIESWQRAYYRPEDMLLSITGRISLAQVSKLAEDAFRPSTERQSGPKSRPKRLGGPVTRNETVEGESPSGLAAAVIGYAAPAAGSPDYPVMMLAEAVLSGGMGSKVFKELRERKDLAYTFGSFMPPLEDTSRIAFYAVSEPDRIDSAVEGVKRSVEDLKGGGVTEEEIVRAKGQALGKLALSNETALGMAWYAGFYELAGLGPDYGEKLVKQIDRLDRDDLVKAARKYLDRYTLVLLKPKK